MEYTSTVYVIDDDQVQCQALKWLLGSIYLSVKIYSNPTEFLAEFNPAQRGCIISDIRMPGMSGLELLAHLNAIHAQMPMILITGHGDIGMAVTAIKGGAYDFITKPYHDQSLLEQVQKALALQQAQYRYQQEPALNSRYQLLTRREREILSFVALGKLNKEIAFELGISMKTVELHRAHVMQKMAAKSLAELVKFYLILTKSC